MSKLISKKAELIKITSNLKKRKRKIVLVHGVFDLIHMGHLEYFSQAKKYGDILIVSVTADRFVKKGINKPYYNHFDRCRFLTSLEVVNYVYRNDNIHAGNLISLIKPNYYVKGPDYAKKNGDLAGNLKTELASLKKVKGKFEITTGKQYSSTKIINENLLDSNLKQNNILKNFKKKINTDQFIKEFKSILNKIRKQKVLIIGEIIFDEYYYVNSLGQPSKENILAVNSSKEELFYGGVLPVVKNISQICKNVSLLSIYKDKNVKKRIKKFLGKGININIFENKNFINIIKKRYVDIDNYKKIFEVYNFKNEDFADYSVKKFLEKKLKSYDHVIVCDFGHGLINKDIANYISQKSKFLSVNVQTNAGNRGYNLFSKYKKVDFLCLDEPELRLGLQEKKLVVSQLINSISKKYHNIMITRGIHGLTYKHKNKTLIELPALNTSPLDTLGAGDAAYSFASSFVKNSNNPKLIALVSAIAGALKIQIVGHRKFINIDDIYRSVISLTK